jgi:hypothetical protein
MDSLLGSMTLSLKGKWLPSVAGDLNATLRFILVKCSFTASCIFRPIISDLSFIKGILGFTGKKWD